MKFQLLLLCVFAMALLAFVVVWLFRAPKKCSGRTSDLSCADDQTRRHVTYFPQIRQAMAGEDFSFLAAKGGKRLLRKVRGEREKITLDYLSYLRADFMRLWRLARVVASMSAKVAPAEEFERVRLGLVFCLRYEMLRFKLVLGFAPSLELSSLSGIVGKLALRLENAMSELGEGAALAAELASAPDRRRLHA